MLQTIRRAIRTAREERGSMLATTGLLLPVFLGVMALSVDMSYVYTQRRLVQNSADASAIAGATVMGRRAAFSTADHETYAAVTEAQQANLTNGAETYAYYAQAFYTNSDGSRAEMVGVPCGDLATYYNQNGGVQVVAQRSVPTFFGAFLPWNGSGNYSASEKQTVTITANPTQGYFYLTVSGGDYWTSALAYNATAAQVQSALEALPQIGSGNVQVTSPNSKGGPYTVTFRAGMSNLNVIQLQGVLFGANNGATITVGTAQDGSGWRKEITVGGKSTALLRLITGVPANHPDFAPYIHWVGSRSWKGNTGQLITYYQNQYIANWVNLNQDGSTTPDAAWTGTANNFRGYLSNVQGVIRTGDVLTIDTSGGNSQGNQPLTMLQDHYDRVKPIIIPVVTYETGSGSNVIVTVVGFSWIDLNYSGAPRPVLNPNNGLKGKVMRWVGGAGFETGTGSGTSTGTSAPAKLVVLSPNQ